MIAGLASRYTSFVAVDPKEQSSLKESWMMMKSRDVPVQVAHGWGGGGFPYALGMAAPPSFARRAKGGGGGPQMMACYAAPLLMDSNYMPMCDSMGNYNLNNQHLCRMDFLTIFPPQEPMALSKKKKSNSPIQQLQRFLSRKARISPSSSVDQSHVGMSRAMSSDSDQGWGEIEEADSGGEVYDGASTSAKTPAPITDDDKLMQLVSIQGFDGAFKMDGILSKLLNTTLDDIKDGTSHFKKNTFFTQSRLNLFRFLCSRQKGTFF